MASYHCKPCDLHYPKSAIFNNCPICGYSTDYRSQGIPISDQECAAIIRQAKFDEWCRDNGRSDTDPPLEPRVIIHRDHTVHDGMIALLFLDFLETLQDCPELHVTLTGLVRGL